MSPAQGQHLRNVALLCLLAGIAKIDWVLTSLYHKVYSSLEVAGAMLCMAAVIGAAVGLAAWLVRADLAERASRALIVLAAAYLFQTWLRIAVFPSWHLTALHKLALLVATIGLSLGVAVLGSSAGWARLRGAVTAAAVVFAGTPFLSASLRAPSIDLQFGQKADVRTSNVLYVVFDEMSGSTQSALVERLQAAGAQISSIDTTPVGSDTLHVLPAMLGGPLMTDARVCTLHAVCGQRGVFDYGAVHVRSDPPAHAVGFFNPYCAMSGWRSCAQLDVPAPNPFRSLACTFGRLAPTDETLCSSWIEPQHWTRLQAAARNALTQSPFWTSGGVLFAHLPYPHPPGSSENASLAVDYGQGLQITSDIAIELWERAKRQFGSDFRIVITSDHPLRKTLWCRATKYKIHGCEMQESYFAPKVPFVIASPRPVTPTPVDSNKELFLR